MIYSKLHEFDVSREEMIDIQNTLVSQINTSGFEGPINIIAGVDISYIKDTNDAVCCIHILDRYTLERLETVIHKGIVETEYVAGFLSFRELPLFLNAWEKVTIKPDLVVFDGNGTLHKRGFGLACHAGLFIDIPTFGVAKTAVCEFEQPSAERGSYTNIEMDGVIRGAALRTQSNVKTVFVSPGCDISLEQTIELSLEPTRADGVIMKAESRIPCITRIPDILSREYIRNLA